MKWLATGISPAARVDALLDHMAAIGWALAWRDGTTSYANPVTRNVVLAHATRDALDLAAVLAHELAHARQFGGPWWRRWWRGLAYLASRRRRLAMEIEARAHACAVYLAAGLVPDYSAGTLAGWRWPYLTGADAGEVERAVRDAAGRLG